MSGANKRRKADRRNGSSCEATSQRSVQTFRCRLPAAPFTSHCKTSLLLLYLRVHDFETGLMGLIPSVCSQLLTQGTSAPQQEIQEWVLFDSIL